MDKELIEINKLLFNLVLPCCILNQILYSKGCHQDSPKKIKLPSIYKSKSQYSSTTFPLEKRLKKINKPSNNNMEKVIITGEIPPRNNNNQSSIRSLGNSSPINKKYNTPINSNFYNNRYSKPIKKINKVYEVDTQKKAKNNFNSYLYNAKLGNTQSMIHLGDCYYKGIGVTQNKSTALEWYKKAADLGNVSAMMKLGDIIINENRSIAVLWYRKAAQNGHLPAKKILNTINEDW